MPELQVDTSLFPSTELSNGARNSASHAPLAARMRPRTLDEFLGQESVMGAGTLLRRAIEPDNSVGHLLGATGQRQVDAGADHRANDTRALREL